MRWAGLGHPLSGSPERMTYCRSIWVNAPLDLSPTHRMAIGSRAALAEKTPLRPSLRPAFSSRRKGAVVKAALIGTVIADMATDAEESFGPGRGKKTLSRAMIEDRIIKAEVPIRTGNIILQIQIPPVTRR